MIEIVPPLYLAIACIFIGTTIAGWPGLDARLLPGERANWFGLVGGVTAALASVCIALVPVLGRWLLPVSTIAVWVCFLATTLRVRSWHKALPAGFAWRSFLGLGLLCGLTVLQAALVKQQAWRVIWQGGLSFALLAWMFVELLQISRKAPSLQLSLMRWCTMGLAGVVGIWSWVLLLSEHRANLLFFSSLFSEAALAFSMRLFLVALLVLLLIGANGYGLERIVKLKAAASDEKLRAQKLNEELQQALEQKNEMLRALSLSSRSRNFPSIMSSLSHEINQPLGAIRLNADFLMAEDKKMPEGERQLLLQQLANASMQATQVVADFRRFFEVNQAPHVLLDLAPLLTDLQRALHSEAIRQQVHLSLTMAESLQVTGDPVQLESALTGIILQMLRRCTASWRQMRVHGERLDGFVQVSVVDDGPALSQAVFDQTFVRPMAQGSENFTQGLWLSRAIVEHHGGTLSRFDSDSETGICLKLPIGEEK